MAKKPIAVSENGVPAGKALPEKALLKNAFLGRLFSRLLPDAKTRLKIKQSFGSFCERFGPFRLYKAAVNALLCSYVRSTSAGFLGFGLIGCIICAIKMNLIGDPALYIPDLSFCASFIIASIPMAFSNSRWCEVLTRSLFMKLWLGYIGGYQDYEIMRTGESKNGGRVFSLVCVFLGAATIFVSPITVFFIALAVIIACQILFKPELGLALSILLFAFIPGSVLCALSVFTLFSFILKLFRGK
ncbi:MAG: hypothetical protein IJV00_08165, partial [Clostridia bacterium]|nr:hypothetical protein [Clostridia bacterium]